MCLWNTERAKAQREQNDNELVRLIFIYLFLMFSLFTSPARNAIHTIYTKSCTMCELSGKLVKSLRIFHSFLFLARLFRFDSVPFPKATSIMCLLSECEFLHNRNDKQQQRAKNLWLSFPLFFGRCFFIRFYFDSLFAVFHASCHSFFFFFFFCFFSLSFSANTRDGHYNSSSVHATKHRADIKVQCYSLRCSALGWWCWCCCCLCHTVVMLTIHWIIIF